MSLRRALFQACLALTLAGPAAQAQAPTPAHEGDMLIGMAASLRGIEPWLRAQLPGEPAFSFLGSGTLAAQAQAGAPFDVLCFASPQPAEQLLAAGLVDRDEVVVFAGNRLVLACRADSPLAALHAPDLATILAEAKRVGLCNAATAPAGAYAVEALRRYPRPADGPALLNTVAAKKVETENVSEMAALLARGEADCGFVYASNVAEFDLREIELEPPLSAFGPPIEYPAIVLAGSTHKGAARAVVALLRSPAAAPEWRRLGLEPMKLAEAAAPGAQPPPFVARPADAGISPLALSLAVAATATLLCLLVGLPLAWLLARHTFPLRWLTELLLLLPLVLPPSVIGFLGIVLFGREGPLGAPIEAWTGWSLLFTWWGAVAAATIVSLPLFVKPLQSAFEAIPSIYFEEATLMGMTRRQELLRLALPLAQRGLVSGLALAAARALGEFGATLMIAGNIPGRTQTLPLAIYSAATIGDFHAAGMLTLQLLALAVALVAVARLASRRVVEFG